MFRVLINPIYWQHSYPSLFWTNKCVIKPTSVCPLIRLCKVLLIAATVLSCILLYTWSVQQFLCPVLNPSLHMECPNSFVSCAASLSTHRVSKKFCVLYCILLYTWIVQIACFWPGFFWTPCIYFQALPCIYIKYILPKSTTNI